MYGISNNRVLSNTRGAGRGGDPRGPAVKEA